MPKVPAPHPAVGWSFSFFVFLLQLVTICWHSYVVRLLFLHVAELTDYFFFFLFCSFFLLSHFMVAHRLISIFFSSSRDLRFFLPFLLLLTLGIFYREILRSHCGMGPFLVAPLKASTSLPFHCFFFSLAPCHPQIFRPERVRYTICFLVDCDFALFLFPPARSSMAMPSCCEKDILTRRVPHLLHGAPLRPPSGILFSSPPFLVWFRVPLCVLRRGQQVMQDLHPNCHSPPITFFVAMFLRLFFLEFTSVHL